jgi:hypothetical protein
MCNSFKGVQTSGYDPLTGQLTPLFHPRRDIWAQHFARSDDGLRIHGRTPTGRSTVEALQLNNVIALLVRRAWVSVGWHPPE